MSSGASGWIAVIALGVVLVASRAFAAEPTTAPVPPPASAGGAAPATAPSDGPQKLLAWGSDADLWVALTRPPVKPSPWSESPPEPPVRLHLRSQGDSQWHELPPVDQPIVSAARRGIQAAILLEDGEWRLVDDGSVLRGYAVPVNHARLLALGNDADTVWALASIPGGVAGLAGAYPAATTVPNRFDRRPPMSQASAPSTSPITQPTTNLATTAPTTTAAAGPLPDVVSLIRLKGDRWVGECDLPASVCSNGDTLSLAIVDAPGDARVPHVAVGRNGQVRLYLRAKENAWQQVGDAIPLAGVRTFRLMSGPEAPLLWLGANDAGAPDRIVVFSVAGLLTASLECTRGSLPEMRALAWATGRIRSLYVRDKVLWECVFDPRTLQPAAEPMAIQWDNASGEAASAWRYGIVAAAMVISLAVSFRQRQAMRTTSTEALAAASLRLAPLGLRAGAGLIDAVPVIAALFMMAARANFVSVSMGPQWDEQAELIYSAGILLYVLHTLIGEMFFGRTVGKAVCGLQVVKLNGEPPSRLQFAGRNLLRVIDAGLFFLPLAMVLFSPLHQRAGDVAAGTLVVQTTEEDEEPAEEA